MAAYAALMSLMNNIEQIQRHTRLPITFDQEQSESLLEKVTFLIDFLESYHYHGVGKEMEDLESRITDAAYAAEDIIETHVVDKIHDYSKSSKGVNKSNGKKNETVTTIFASQTEKNTYLRGIDKVMENMDFIKEEAMKIEDRREIDGLPITSTVINAPSSSSILFGKNAMVGFENELTELLERLTGRHSRLQVIPIVGMGGKGKTTLARTAYEKPLVLQYFDLCAWVSISQEYSVTEILIGLLRNVASQMGDHHNDIDSSQLGERLYKTLYGRRYLIVLDDIWSIKAWESVMAFLPDNDNGSRIIVTTRISSLAIDLGWSNLEVNFLDEEKGWNLFCEKVFGQECCPRELEELGRKIVKNCQGLPLSIVVIGGLLAKSERTTKFWEYIARDTSAIVSSEDEEMCMKILYLSYHNLPVHLKPCFLYMGVFPEDEEIKVSQLINLWVAEGFLKPNSFKELEVVANEYLNDLISRNLIIIRGHGKRGNVNRCMIHDLLRNLCLKEAHKGKFLCVPTKHDQDEVQSIGNQRRISIPAHSNICNHLGTRKTGFLGRSLICRKLLPVKKFRLLRVLAGIYSDDRYMSSGYTLGDTLKLVNLRLMSTGTSYLKKIPSSICLLWNLQILVIVNLEVVTVPLEIWEMTELRHLEIYYFLFRLPQDHLPNPPLDQQIKTQAIMKNLHTLKGIRDLSLSDKLVKRISNIKKLELRKIAGKKLEERGLQYLYLFKNLESLKMVFAEPTPPDRLSYLTFPISLKKLTLWSCGLQWEEMSKIASLPLLQVLKLMYNSFKGPIWELDEEEIFPCLKYLEIYSCEDLVHWIADDTHFPVLAHLKLDDLDKLVKIPSRIGDIPTLQKIVVFNCCKSVVISAKNILDEQESLDNLSLKVKVFCKKDAELESLASNNFIVTAR